MDIFTRFNSKNIQYRQVDTLIGLSKGLASDGKINQPEVEFLQAWLIQNSHSENPIIANLLHKVSEILEDGIVDEEESLELLTILHAISGDKVEVGEVARSSNLPLCQPPTKIAFSSNTFLFTGTCAFGTRKECQAVIDSYGGMNASGVTKKLNYLVLGTYVTDSWAHETFGRKIEKAMEYRDAGIPLTIISEKHWLTEAGL